MRKILLITFLGLLFFNSFPSLISVQEEQGLVPCDLTPGGPHGHVCAFCDLFVLADNIIDFLLLRIIPVLAALLIALGGFMYIIGRGSPDELARVKKLFTSVGIGLLIIYGAWLIVFSFLFVFGGVAWEGFGEGWWVVYCD